MRRLLVVDDDRQMVRTFIDIVRLHGWDADGAHTGEEALAALERADYDVVLMDVRMPGMNGVEALAAMRKARPEIRVILMTAFSAAELIEQAKREGALAVIPKPVAIPSLVEILDRVVADRKAVLVVDDEPQFLRTLSGILRSHGYEVLEAGSLDEAVARMQESWPGIVLLDLRLDHIEPRDSILAIRRLSPIVTIILYSGHPELLDEAAASVPSQWIHATLTKPFSPERLMEVLNAVPRR